MIIGKVIRRYRKEKGLTQEEMAIRLGVSTSAVNKWENDNTLPDISLLVPIARLFGINDRTNSTGIKCSYTCNGIFARAKWTSN